MCTFGLIACYWGRGGRIGYEKKRNSGLFRFKLDSEGILTFVSSRPPTTRTYERRHLFAGPSESSLKRNGPPSECPLVQYLFSFLSPPRINASPSTASLASDVKPVLLAVYTIEEKLKCCQMMIRYSSYREWRKKIYLYIHRNEQTRPTWVNGLV